ncbi:MAG TPA: DUF3048 domain-containing protein [Candidatus Saccharimonadales bacterium]|nr:DUF3048 domain-containing protein [Candidatus Saccharimonadales bacterium]
MIDDMNPRPRRAPEPTSRPMPQYNPRIFTKPGFHTPQEVASRDQQIAEVGAEMNDDTSDNPYNETLKANHKPPRRSFKQWLKTRTKKQWVAIILLLILVLGGIGAGVYFLFIKNDKPVVSTVVKKKKAVVPAPTTVASNLSGLQVDPTVNQRPVTAVMIENSASARPQSGLDQANVVFEAVAEGGITRFEALFQDTTPGYIGPVRSVRPYYIQWGMAFDAAIAHVGGSGEALQDMKDWKVKDLDQFANGSYFQRISSRDAPHNVYTSMSQLNDLEAKRGYGAAKFSSLLRKGEERAKTPEATSIDVKISGSLYNSHYDYDAEKNAYKRSQGGGPHMQVDANGSQTQIEPKVVIALTMSQGIAHDDTHTAYGTIGTGHAYIFQDGKVTEGTWKKAANAENFTFTNLSGKPIGLNPGQTWITAVGDTSYVSYK